jgi:WD40 repeat protein
VKKGEETDVLCESASLLGHSGAVLSVVFHARLPLLVAGNAGKCVKVWNLNGDGTHAVCVATLHDHAEEHGSVDFHPVLPLFATFGALTMWQLNCDYTGIHCVAVVNAHSTVYSVGFHAMLPLLATGSADGSVRMWPVNSSGTNAACVASLLGHKTCVRHVAFHLHLPLLATSTGDTIHIWNELE